MYFEGRTGHKKKKVARQFISFDDDDSSILSTSLPSTSSSSSDSADILSSKIMDKIEETKSEVDKTIKRQLSIETSGTRDKFTGDIPETLTPVIQTEIGELTPVSVEISNNSPGGISDEILEVPTDISAVLTALELRNSEELNKKQGRIDILVKENDILKDQIKKYVSAIQLLQNDDEDVENTLKNLGISENQPNYKDEAKLFEKKLVQVGL